MSRPRPRIGITGPDRGGLSAWLFTAWAVRRAGGRPVRIRPRSPHSIDSIDALVIGGGADVSPDLYGAEPLPALESFKDNSLPGWRRLGGIVMFPLLFVIRRLLTTRTSGLNQARDTLEKGLIAAALERGMPLLGICRGMQLLNVVAGGSLHQDIEGFYEEYPAIRSVLPRKRIEIESDSLLAQTLVTTRVRVNALHSQAIDRLGDGLRVCARESSGVIQAIEGNPDNFAIGVQWHPEYLPQRPEQRALFRSLVKAVNGAGP
ncbi:MAG: gamma-glutamyl-gamma-aminobutyrate hydrolase family protein [Wenzhouxiangella sp.]|nr:MAG: gamma-glutamyl-gamma-aminobutyrate hydrolase family protein [Wenzhouxiangella sp.]